MMVDGSKLSWAIGRLELAQKSIEWVDYRQALSQIRDAWAVMDGVRLELRIALREWQKES
jgi:hypothetical protein